MSLSSISESFTHFFEAFGYYTEDTVDDSENVSHDEGSILNRLNIAGYFPVISIVSALCRWKHIYSDYKENSYILNNAYAVGQIVHGILEFIGLGLVVGLFIDLPVSLIRHRNSFPSCGQETESENFL